MIKKVVISTRSTKAVAFFEELDRKKEATRKMIEEKTAHVREMLKKKTLAK